jgi:hypothetical protein
VNIRKPIDLIDGDLLIHNENYLTGDIFKFYNEDSILIYKKEIFTPPSLTNLKYAYLKFRKAIDEMLIQ